MKLKLGSYRVFVIGIIMGLSAAALQAFFLDKPADGISFIGHPADLLNWIANHLFGTSWPVQEDFAVTASVAIPILTVVGVFIGSYIAARRSKELRLRPGPVGRRFSAVIFGFLVINFGMLLGSCPIRVGLMVGDGGVLAVIALTSIVAGVILATVYIRSRAGRGIRQ